MRLLSGPLTFQVFADHTPSDGKPVYPGQKHGTLAEHKRFLQYVSKRGAGIYFTVNQTDGAGRKTENITRIRAYMIDCDGLSTPAAKHAAIERLYATGLKPSAIVETKNGLHAYWYSTGEERIDPHEYRRVNRRLAHHYGADINATDITRVLRVPGFPHQKDPRNPFMVTLISEDPTLLYTPEQLLEAYPPAPSELTTHATSDTAPIRLNTTANAGNSRAAQAYIAAAITNQSELVRTADHGERNAALNRAAFSLGKLANLESFDATAIEAALLDAATSAGLTPHEATSTIRSGLTAGQRQPRSITLTTQEAAA